MNKESKTRILGSDNLFTKWFEEVYEDHFEILYRYAFSITKNKQQAEDVVSDVFANIWRTKPDYSNIKELSAYLHVSVKHLAIRQVSQDPQRFSHFNYDESLQISDSINPENLLLGKELDKIINEVLNALPGQGRLVYDMARTEGRSYDEISIELGISKRTVEGHIHTVLKKIKTRLLAHFKDADQSSLFISHLGSLIGLEMCLSVYLPS